MDLPSWAPASIATDKASAARVYDYLLGGSHNFDVDREVAEKATALWPELPRIMRGNRAFLQRAVWFLADHGITQFIDIGSGIPTQPNVHEVARRYVRGARVAYVDNDPIAVTSSWSILNDDPYARIIEGDLRKPDDIFTDPDLSSLIDLDQPVAVLLVAVLHFLSDADNPMQIVNQIRDLIAPGSYIVVCHATSNNALAEQAKGHEAVFRQADMPIKLRSREEIEDFFTGFEIVEPGIVHFPLWRPTASDEHDAQPERFAGIAGVGKKL